MAVKVTRGKICDGSILKNSYHKEYYLCGKFHNCITKCMKCPFFVLCRSTSGYKDGVGVKYHRQCLLGHELF